MECRLSRTQGVEDRDCPEEDSKVTMVKEVVWPVSLVLQPLQGTLELTQTHS